MYNKDFILVTKQLFLYALDSQTFYLFIFLIKKWENVDWKFSTKEQSQRSFIQAIEKKNSEIKAIRCRTVKQYQIR